MIEKVLIGNVFEPFSTGYCICGCTCPYGDIERAVDRGASAADWTYAAEEIL